ncbi:Retrovirus-related Pol polyprotein from transposon RE2 [Vitis vinifera]|uniref:Retrovirus-related Pol polyprotein from transposon RE2 n=1 Tax=Vitis vinifera TaxID=29760 RepID=A0A438KCE8_VITVI|nr:Retrovirus-related Pol polyprotein from transposon RE2 [Vitis vinifera]
MEESQPFSSQPPELYSFPFCNLEKHLPSPSGPHLPNSAFLSQSPTEENQRAFSNQLSESSTPRKSSNMMSGSPGIMRHPHRETFLLMACPLGKWLKCERLYALWTLSWNVRETKKEKCDRRFVSSVWMVRNKDWVVLPAFGASGGILFIWDSNKLCKEEVVLGSFSISVKFALDGCGPLWISAVYDFNIIRRSSEKLGGSRLTSSMRDFDSFIRECELLDPPLRNASFTCSFPKAFKKPLLEGPQIIGQLLWIPTRSCGPQHLLDLRTCGCKHPSFKENFRNWWRGFQGNGWEGHKFMRRLQSVKAKLKEWNKLSFGKLNEKKKKPSFIPAKSLWPSLNPTSLSLPSLIPVISPYSQSQGRKRFPVVESSSENIHRRQLFRRTFRRRFFSTPQGAPGGDLQFVPKHRNQKPIHAPPRAFFRPRLHLTRRRVRAREPLSGDALPPPSSPDADQPPFLPVLPSEPCTCLFWGSFASGALRSVFPASSGYFFSTPIPARALEVFFYLSGHKLNGHNYLQWSQSVLLFICGKGKDEYLTGEAAMPETTEPGFRKWKIENSMIMSWLINSMNNDIGENFLLFGTAKDIWDAAKETYSSSENTSELFQVESALHDFRQGEQSVTQYYNTLTRYWQQLDLFETHSWKCSDDAATYRQIVEQKRLFKFFLGLNRELDDVRGRIMGIKPLPSLREAFSEVRREESRKKVMMGSKSNLPQHWMLCPCCSHICSRAESIQQRADGDATETIKPSWQWQYYRVAFTANRGGMKPWIVDTGASDHMTGDAAILQNYKPSNGHSSVHIADGSKSKIAGTGSIKLTKDLYLDSVLHVPNLDCNLLSISKLARDLQCVTKFYPNSCVFQDLKSGKMIGSAELCSGLYLLSCGQFSNQVSQASCVQSQRPGSFWRLLEGKSVEGSREVWRNPHNSTLWWKAQEESGAF